MVGRASAPGGRAARQAGGRPPQRVMRRQAWPACAIPTHVHTSAPSQTNLITARPEAGLEEVQRTLAGPPAIEGLPVVDAAGVLVGVVSKKDLAKGGAAVKVRRGGRAPLLLSTSRCARPSGDGPCLHATKPHAPVLLPPSTSPSRT